MADAGRVLLMPKGTYSSGTNYEVLDWVRYSNGTYASKHNNNQGNTPTGNPTDPHWALLCQDGSGGGSTVAWTQIQATGTKIATIEIDGVQTDVYAPTGGGGTGAWVDITGKPFISVGSDGLKVVSGILDVDLTKVQSILSDATTSVSGKMSAADKEKLDGIDAGANNYALPTMSDTVKGGAKIGAGLSILEEVLSAAVAGLIDDETDFNAQTVSTSQAVDSFILKEILDDMNGIALTSTLTASATSITLTDAAIVTDNTVKYDYYTDVYGVSPTAVSVSTGSMTLTFAAQTVDVAVRVEIREV